MYFSRTQSIAARSPGLLDEQMLKCTCSPHMFSTTLEEVHVWNDTGSLGAGDELELLGALGGTELLLLVLEEEP